MGGGSVKCDSGIYWREDEGMTNKRALRLFTQASQLKHTKIHLLRKEQKYTCKMTPATFASPLLSHSKKTYTICSFSLTVKPRRSEKPPEKVRCRCRRACHRSQSTPVSAASG